MVRAIVLLLLLLAGLYIGLEILRVTEQDLLFVNSFNLPPFMQSTEFRAFLGIGIIICEFIIILFSMLYGIADTIRDVIKPLARLIPLGLFVMAIYRTFEPIFTAEDPVAYLTTAAADGTLTRAILFSLGSMLLFVLANRALGGETSKIKSLEAELAKLRRGRG